MTRMKRIIKLVLAFTITLSCVLSNALVAKAIGNRVNFALNKTATASYYDSDSHTPDKVFDGDLSTRWGTDPYGSNQWIRVDLDKNYDFDEFYIASENNDNQKIRKFKIEGSNNDIDYDLIYQGNDKPEGYDLETTINLEDSANYRYVRITIEKLIDGAYPSISLREFGVIGNEEERISSVKEALNKLSISSKIYRDFKVPLYDNLLGVGYNWVSENDTLIVNGDTIKVNVTDKAKSAILNVTASKDGYSQNRTFKVQVVPLKSGDYNIYPVPQEMTYGDETLDIKENINIVMDNTIDKHLVDFLVKTLNEYQLNVSINEAKDDFATNIYLGIDGIDSLAKQSFADINYKNIAGIDEGYALNVSAKENTIVILGNDYSGLFSGVFTLEQMLASSSKTFKEITILDAPDTKFRGIVEGFYGSYSHKERLDLLEFMGPLKMNTYIYGAKSDAYHSGKWRELYPENQINELEELVTRGKENNVEVVWAAHVGGKINMADSSEFDALVKKFDQLYDIGVRQFGLFYDDAATDNTHLIDFVNKVNREYVQQREGVKDLIICPEQYCKTRVSGDYLDRLANFDQNVQIMWTGDGVISDITPSMMEYIESRIKRPAYIWWNYPVNDLGMGDQLLVGETVGLSTKMSRMNGLVSNPMLQAQASKFSLFSIADYSWNINDFDQYKSWENSVDYIIPEKEYADAFKIFSANNNQSVAELQDQAVESRYLLEKMQGLKQDLYLGFDISESGEDLLGEFKKIETSCELLKGYSNNQALVNQIKPWVDTLSTVSQAGQLTLENLLYLNDHPVKDNEMIATVHQKYLECQNKLASVGSKYSGRRELLPFIYEMQRNIGDNLVRTVGNYKTTPITNYRNGSYLMTDLSKMIDGDQDSAVTFERNETKGFWYGLDLGRITDINKIEIFVGVDDKDQNVAKKYKVQISNDGFIWKDIEVTDKDNKIKNINKEKARFVRYLVEEGCGKKASVREFKVNNKDMVVASNVSDYKEFDVTVTKNLYTINHIDNFRLREGEYIGIEFIRAKQFSNIQVNDELKGLTLQYSTDGVNWNNYENDKFIARYIRLINTTGTEFNGVFDYLKVVGPEMFTPKEIGVTMSEGMQIWSGSTNDLVDGNRNTTLWTREQKSGDHFILDLKEEMPIKDISVIMTSGDIMESGVIEVSKDKETWSEVGKITKIPENIIFINNQTARYIKIKLTSTSANWLKINEIEVNQLSSVIEVPVIEDKEAALIIDQDVQTKYVVPNQAGEIIYNNINNSNATIFNILKNNESSIKIEGLFGEEWKEIKTSSDGFINADFKQFGTASKFKLSWLDNSNLSIYEVWTSGLQDTIEKKLLLQMIEKAQLLEANGALDKVHETVVQFFHTALANAISVSSNPEAAQVEVDNAYQQLTYAIQLLDFKADKTLLKALIDECDAIDLSKYEAASQNEFKAALKNAKDVYDNPNALDEVSILKAVDELTKAKGNLVLKQINTGRLEYMIKLAEEALNNAGKYKQDEVWKVFVERLNAAKEALAKLESQEAIDATTQALSEAYGNLRIKPDESIIEDLRKFLEETKDLDYGKYSLKTQKRIREAVETVERVLANEESSQNELLAASALADEARELIKHPDAKEEDNKETGTATGDNTNIVGISVVALASLVIVLLVRRSRKEN